MQSSDTGVQPETPLALTIPCFVLLPRNDCWLQAHPAYQLVEGGRPLPKLTLFQCSRDFAVYYRKLLTILSSPTV